jgi:ribose transport system ATP-binding protein
MTSILTALKICKSFSGVQVLKDVGFDLQAGEIHGLMGENGAGKSTLMKIIAGDYQFDSGEILFEGKPVQLKQPSDSLNLGIRLIYQEFNLVKQLTVAENICLGDYPTTATGLLDWKMMAKNAQDVLEQLGEKIQVTKKVSEISIDEQQIVEIAKALRKNPRVLIMDEPTAALNDQETYRLFKIIRRMRDNGVSIIFITHRISEQFALSDRITVLRDGSTVATVNTADITADDLISMMVGRVLTNMFVHNKHHPTDLLLEVKNIQVNNKLYNISFNVRKGEIVTIFGLMGAGQKDLCNVLFGDIKSDGGEIWMEGKKLNLISPNKACMAGIGLVSDDRKSEGLFPKMNVKENASVAILKSLSRIGVLNGKKEHVETEKWIKKLNVRCSGLSQKIVSLSGGNQQKVVIARWLAKETKLLIMNLPTRGIDVGAKAEIYNLLDQFCEEGMGVLIFSLEMPEVLGISDRIYVMCDGSITGEVNNETATQDLLMRYAVCKYMN